MGSEKRPIVSPRAPAALGPYSQGIQAGGFVFVSGQIGLKPQGGEPVGPDAAAQARQCLENVRAILEACGSGLGDVVKTTVFLCDLKDFAAVNAVYEGFFHHLPPARSTVQVAALPADARVEIEATAYVARAWPLQETTETIDGKAD